MRRWGLTGDLIWLTASMGLWGLGFGLYGFLWPLYVEHLGGNAVVVGLLSTIAGIATALVVFPGGYWADRIERKKILMWGWAVAIPAPFMFAMAPHWQWLVPGVVLYFGSAFSTPALQAVVLEEASPATLSTAYNVVMNVFGMGMVIGPTVGGLLVTHYSYRPVFVLSGIFYLASTACLLPLKQHPPKRVTRTKQRWRPRQRPHFFRWVMFSGALAVIQGITWPFVVPYLKDAGHLPVETIGILSSTGILIATLSGPLWGRLGDRLGLPRALGYGLGIVTIGWILLLWNPSSLGWALSSGILRGGGEGVRGLPGVAIGRTVRAEEAGTAYGMYNLVTELAGALAPLPGGYLFSRWQSMPMVITAFFTAIVAWWLLTQSPSIPSSDALPKRVS
jgi:DHA1 family tetracycline resistance protein-like MFS transporter